MENAQTCIVNNFYRRRNSPTYTFMAWSAFIIAAGFEFIGIYNPLFITKRKLSQ